MLKKLLSTFTFVLLFAVSAFAQNTTPPAQVPQPAPQPKSQEQQQQQTPASTTTTVTKPAAPTTTTQILTPPATTSTAPLPARTRRTKQQRSAAERSTSAATDAATGPVNAAFNALIDGIRRADVDASMNSYWNSPQLLLFNNNGTLTRTWDQARSNRASSYPNLKDIKLDVRDVRVQMLGRDAAFVTCLWTQSQIASGTPEVSTGRLSLVFRRVGTAWKIMHAHTSPDAPDPSRLLPSERTTPAPVAAPSTPSTTTPANS